MIEIVAAAGQDIAGQPGVIVKRLKAGDYQLTAADGLLTLVEEKRFGDLLSSYRSHRLQRQLRGLTQANPDGHNILALRGGADDIITLHEVLSWDKVGAELELGLIKWQLLGGLVGFLPAAPEGVVSSLRNWAAILVPGRPMLSILAGVDLPKKVKMTPCAKALSTVVKGLGQKTAEKVAAYFGHDFMTALNASEKLWKAAGAHADVLRSLRELRSSGLTKQAARFSITLREDALHEMGTAGTKAAAKDGQREKRKAALALDTAPKPAQSRGLCGLRAHSEHRIGRG